MSDDDHDDTLGVLAEFTGSERAVIARALQRLEWQLFTTTLKRLSWLVAAVVAAVTIFGLASVETLKTAISEAAAARLASDAVIREEVVKSAANKLERVNEILERAAAMDHQLQVDVVDAKKLVRSDLREILAMTKQIETDLRTREVEKRNAKR